MSKEAGFQNEASEFLITANLNRGNSGGPIFSVDGRVLGIAVAKLDKPNSLKKTTRFQRMSISESKAKRCADSWALNTRQLQTRGPF